MSRRVLVTLLIILTLSGCQDSGDRVLVAKFLYDSNITPPHRYDVVVFKFPAMPIENGSPKNYIKRLLGLPGELIAFFFGQLFRLRHDGSGVPEGITKEQWQDLTNNTRDSAVDLWKHPPKNHEVAQRLWAASRDSEKAGKQGLFEILRKPPEVMLALSRPVFDNDHPAKDVIGILPDRWAPRNGSAWTADNSHGFTIAGPANAEQWLHYRHVLRPADWKPKGHPLYEDRVKTLKQDPPAPRLITDFLGYNTYRAGTHDGNLPGNWVGDLMLSCKLTIDEPKGEFWMELCRGVDRFQARFDLATGKCSLYRRTTRFSESGARSVSEWKQLASADTRVKGKGEFQITFANYDERLTVWVGSDLPFGDGKEYPSPADVGPDSTPLKENGSLDDIENNDLQPASLCSVGASVKVHNILLRRDTYYTSGFHEGGNLLADQNTVREDMWAQPNQWNDIRKIEARTIYVYPGHYLCLGDNSQESSDSRQWGLVPQRLMLGRALLVYFPFERAGTIK